MGDRTRRWLRLGLVLGTALAGAAHCRRRFRTADREPDPVTERHGAAFLVRRRLDPDRVEDVSDAVERRRSNRNGRTDRRWPLGLERASTATLFLDRSADEPELVWYVEVPRTVVDAWADPAATVADAFPVAHDAIRETEVDDAVERELLVHAAHPSRPRTVDAETESSDRPDGDAGAVDVDLVRMDLEPGLPERFADWFAGVSRRVIDGETTLGRIEPWSVEMLEAEGMYTESVFLERRADGYSLVQYMEAAEMEGVYEAYYDTWNPVARISEFVVGRILVDPDVILAFPLETDVEPLAHATSPDRPRRAAECPRTVDGSSTA